MNKIEQAYFDYLKSTLLPVLEGHIGDEVTPEVVKQMEDELIEVLKAHMIQYEYEWEVI
jgi:uncharacterized FAD-dependent dehydrogenase